jgi:hypothetical protein
MSKTPTAEETGVGVSAVAPSAQLRSEEGTALEVGLLDGQLKHEIAWKIEETNPGMTTHRVPHRLTAKYFEVRTLGKRPRYKCDRCGAMFDAWKYLKLHKIDKHSY